MQTFGEAVHSEILSVVWLPWALWLHFMKESLSEKDTCSEYFEKGLMQKAWWSTFRDSDLQV